jgi:putative cell wall-binding protein
MRRWLGFVAGAVAAAVLATAAPAEAVPIWTRIAEGTDRYDTAVKLSFAMFPTPPVDTVYVASGEQFPDALAAGAVAAAAPANGGPVLLTRRDTLPDVTKAELDRLNPTTIVLVGGTGAVAESVKTALEAYGTVTRVFGASRFETSAGLSSARFPSGAPVAYVATGAGSFADALSGSAAAGSEGGPVLLVETHSVPAAVGTELDRLNPTKIVVLGGVQAIGPEVQLALQVYAPNVERVQGVDRYATSAAVSADTFAVDRPFAFVVTGDAFPDGLAAGAIGGGRDVPVLLTRKSCMPQVIATELTRLNPGQVYVVGGTGVITTDDQNRQPVCT